MFTLNCNGKLLLIDQPVVMGIINLTPDSFYAGSRAQTQDAVLFKAEKMLAEGAKIIDIGGQSTRPGSKRISVDEELENIIPAVENILKSFPGTIISIDTYQSVVAEKAIDAGASIVNDISAGSMDEAMIETVGKLRVPYVCMHMNGTPENMQQNAAYENVTREVLDFFIRKTAECKLAGIKDIIVDPGFGFGKTITQNFKLLRDLAVFKMLDKPLLAGISRKSTIYKSLNIPVEDSLNGTTVLNTLALNNGANILRVHDVKEAMQAINLFQKYSES